jgi:hypothetical protein
MEDNEMKNNVNISENTCVRKTYNNTYETMYGWGAQKYSSGIASSNVLQKDAEMRSLEEEIENEEKKANMRKSIFKIFMIIWAAILSVFAVLVMQPMDLATSIVCGVALFGLMFGRIASIFENMH